MVTDFGVVPSKAEIAERLRAAVKAAGGNQVVAEKSGIPIGTLNNYMREVSEPKAIALSQIARACGVSADFIIFGGDDFELAIQQSELNSSVARFMRSTGQASIMRLSFTASAGHGTLVSSTETEVPFLEELLKRLSLHPDDARLLVAEGDSMAPTIADGDMLVVEISNAARERVIDDKIYAFTVGDEGFVKRLRREPGAVVMVSDNKERFPERAVPSGEHFAIIGRVRWVGRAF